MPLGDEPDTVIPSGSSIIAAKQKRERLRAVEKTGEEDYISLSVSKSSDYSQGPHPESRLVREEDELGDADDEYADFTSAQERIALGKKSRKVEAKKKREAMQEMIVEAYARSFPHDIETETAETAIGRRKTRRRWNGSKSSSGEGACTLPI